MPEDPANATAVAGKGGLMTITKAENGDKLTLQIEGRVDTNTSAQLQDAILEAFRASKHVVLDLVQVVYVSSAGLRALLIGQKTATSKGGSMVLVNVSPTVKTVLDSVGFSKILTIA